MRRIIVSTAVLLTMAGCSSGGSGDSGGGGMDQTARDFMAYDACKSAVSDQLKAPSTADFQSELDVDYRTTGGNNITVLGWVDAQNSFGAKLRSNFTCSMDVSKDGLASNVQASVDGG